MSAVYVYLLTVHELNTSVPLQPMTQLMMLMKYHGDLKVEVTLTIDERIEAMAHGIVIATCCIVILTEMLDS